MANHSYAMNIGPFPAPKNPPSEQDITIPMNEEWQRDGGCVTGMDKALQLSIRANETSDNNTKI